MEKGIIPKVYALDGIRATSAILVVVAHLVMRLLKYNILGEEWGWLAKSGSAGVYTFFVISGFVIVRSSAKLFESDGATLSFLIKRAIRVFPLYYIFTILFTVKMAASGDAWSISELLLSLLFVPYQNTDGLMQPIYSLGWSLNYEIYFYIIFSFSLVFSKRIGVIVTCIGIVSIMTISRNFGQFAPNGDALDWKAFYGSQVVLFFLVGMIIALVPNKIMFGSAVCFLIGVCLLALGILSGNDAILAVCCVAAVLFASIERPTEVRSPLAHWMEVAGGASYSIYLTHSFVLGPLVALGIKVGLMPGMAAWIYAVFSIFACAFIGIFAFVLIEKPTLAFLRTRWQKMRPMQIAK